MSKFYKGVLYLILILFIGWYGQGCNIINPHEQVPTYIHVDSFKYVSTFSNITTSHSVTTVWAYYNNNPVGAFDLPATFPVVATDSGRLELFPGVTIDGQNNLTGIYSFYMPDTDFAFRAQPGKILNYIPTTRFYPAAKVKLVSDFSNTNFALNMGNIPIVIVHDDSLVFEGGTSGSILLGSPGDSSIDSTIEDFKIPVGTAFLEFDYKCTVPFYVGMQSYLGGLFSNAPYYLAGIYPSDHWQKFYLSLGDYLASYTGDTYKIYIKASLPDGVSSGRVLLDNIQLISF